jgi:hypothetical protein
MTRKDRIVYWATTGIVAAVMTYSILNFAVFDRFRFPKVASFISDCRATSRWS